MGGQTLTCIECQKQISNGGRKVYSTSWLALMADQCKKKKKKNPKDCNVVCACLSSDACFYNCTSTIANIIIFFSVIELGWH
jgi:hypothetical protein